MSATQYQLDDLVRAVRVAWSEVKHLASEASAVLVFLVRRR